MVEMVERITDIINRRTGFAPVTCESMARDILEAMREPTEEMECTARDKFVWGPYIDDPKAEPKPVWQAMIDAALIPPSEPRSSAGTQSAGQDQNHPRP